MLPLFELRGVSVRRDGLLVLDDLDLAVPGDGITVLTGPSGSGKSTLLRLCNRLLLPDVGTVSFRGTDVARIDPCRLRREVGMVFQTSTPFGGTVLDNLRVAAPLDETAAGALLERVALDASFLARVARDLSGGEQQRVCLARTLATSPVALLVDEGTSALDADATRTLEQLVVEEADRGCPVLWVTHDLAQAERIADHRLCLPRPGEEPPSDRRPGSSGDGDGDGR